LHLFSLESCFTEKNNGSDDLIKKMSGSTHQLNYHNGIKLNLIIRVKIHTIVKCDS